ncbi:MAG: hypothetical protein HY907_14145 [Deltaproteobacteria bacterium]|nr:hypothetical protein [Deltaproteobacteria bacterium]
MPDPVPDDANAPAPPALRVFAHRRVALRYHALAFVPLPGDDADLHRPGYVRAWRRTLAAGGVPDAELDARVEAARAALATVRGRLAAQVDVLADPTRVPAADPLGLLETLLEPAHRLAWDEALEAVEVCRLGFAAGLQRRRALFAPLRQAGLERLDVQLCPSLRAAGRAARCGATYAVAVPLPDDDTSSDAAFLQLVHECCHPLADEALAPFLPPQGADTARGSAGHAAHVLREDAALAIGRAWLRGDPAEAGRYLEWVARFRSRERLAERLDGALDLPQAARGPVLARAANVARTAGS